ncbi:MAG: CIA30 family protein [Kiloniella sp.]|nr:CIA30 family protein [Kiloniella sp.]RZO30727.1 MAG: CIA30 family protein [Rhodospirillaceae bacterium]
MTLNRRKTLGFLGAGVSAASVTATGFGGLVWAEPAAAADGQDTGEGGMSDALIIDDFSSLPDSTIGGRWSYTSDRVMGGVSNGGGGYDEVDGRMAIRLFGQVSTANNGGFIQVSLRLDPRSLAAERYRGIEIDVSGNGEDYNVHLTTTRSFPPWRFYKHSFATSSAWTRHRLPWEDFTSESFRRALDPRTINRLNLTAYARDFEADLAVSRIALFA